MPNCSVTFCFYYVKHIRAYNNSRAVFVFRDSIILYDADFAILKIDLQLSIGYPDRLSSMPVAFTFRSYFHGPHGATVILYRTL